MSDVCAKIRQEGFDYSTPNLPWQVEWPSWRCSRTRCRPTGARSGLPLVASCCHVATLSETKERFGAKAAFAHIAESGEFPTNAFSIFLFHLYKRVYKMYNEQNMHVCQCVIFSYASRELSGQKNNGSLNNLCANCTAFGCSSLVAKNKEKFKCRAGKDFTNRQPKVIKYLLLFILQKYVCKVNGVKSIARLNYSKLLVKLICFTDALMHIYDCRICRIFMYIHNWGSHCFWRMKCHIFSFNLLQFEEEYGHPLYACSSSTIEYSWPLVITYSHEFAHRFS